MKDIKQLLDLIGLIQIEENRFEGRSTNVGVPHVFGGQVLAQALYAAQQTVDGDRRLHSLHSYFILPGDLSKPLIFDVECLRDGGSFSTRRVTVSQSEKVIFISAISFHRDENGLEHQDDLPDIEGPNSLLNWEQLGEKLQDKMGSFAKQFMMIDRPIEFRPVNPVSPLIPSSGPPYNHVWFRARGNFGFDDIARHQQVLAYASDYNILTTTLNPHEAATMMNTQMASLDHAMWFHRDFDVRDWMLYQIWSPSASGARGLSMGKIYTQEGKLVASVVQEGLIRPLTR